MKRLLICLVGFAAMANLGWPEPSAVPPDDRFARELQALAGKWRPISAENNGYLASEAELKRDYWIREADGTWSMWRGGKVVVGWKVKKIDATKVPRAIDLEITMGPYTGIVYLGIYELEGDSLRIAFGLPARPVRPTEFSAHKWSGRALAVFKRERN